MSSVQDQIREAAARNAELLGILSQTDYAPPSMQQQNAYVRDLEGNLKQNEAELNRLGSQREKEHKDHKKYSESVTRRFLYKASGQKEKFSQKADKEEREYFDVLRAEHQAQDVKQKLTVQLDEAKVARSQLEPDVARHEKAQKDLDALYHAIFAGATPDYPEEDHQENEVQSALVEFQRLDGMFRAEGQALELLKRAGQAMRVAQNQVEEALSCSRMDMFGGGAMIDMMERSALGRAEMAAAEAYRLANQAQSQSPHVQALPNVAIAQGSIISDVLFDNIFTDMRFHEAIKASAADLQRAAGILRQNMQSAEQRKSALQHDMNTASSRLGQARQQLQAVREQIFERSAQPPPAYSDAAFT